MLHPFPSSNISFLFQCYAMLKSFKKAEIQLASVLTNDSVEETTDGEDNGDGWEGCKCFKKQPIFVTEKIDGCQLCQQMQTGITFTSRAFRRWLGLPNQTSLVLCSHNAQDLFPKSNCILSVDDISFCWISSQIYQEKYHKFMISLILLWPLRFLEIYQSNQPCFFLHIPLDFHQKITDLISRNFPLYFPPWSPRPLEMLAFFLIFFGISYLDFHWYFTLPPWNFQWCFDGHLTPLTFDL